MSTAPDPAFVALQTALAGRFSLESEIGRGGMGIVYLARDVILERPVAIKLLYPLMWGSSSSAADRIERGEMAGYLLVPHEKVPDTFNAGYSMYVAAWPLVKTYPGSRFQTGLFGTCSFPLLMVIAAPPGGGQAGGFWR